jgi:uncharacterized protein YndB with AHSA1/START domain
MNSLNFSYSYNSSPSTLFSKITNGTLFKLTGADKISFDFKPGGEFRLEFFNRGVISGVITHIAEPYEVQMKWNVEGFGREAENTEVQITITGGEKTELLLEHRNIRSEEAFAAKRKAWTEILNKLDDRP